MAQRTFADLEWGRLVAFETIHETNDNTFMQPTNAPRRTEWIVVRLTTG